MASMESTDLPEGVRTKCREALAGALALGLVFTGIAASAAVHSGDILLVTVYDHPELTGPVSVDTTQHVSMPLAGSVNVAGLDSRQIAVRIREHLKKYIQAPAVDVVSKAQTATIFVSGGPGGTLKYEPGETLIAALGQLSPRATNSSSSDGTMGASDLSELGRSRLDLTKVRVYRDGALSGSYDAIALSAGGLPGPTLQPGDEISLMNKPNAVRVKGQVARPGVAYLAPGEPLADAIAQVGGALPVASTWHIELDRGGTSEQLSLGDKTFDGSSRDGDTLLVPLAPRVNVVGLVEKPGSTILKNDISLLSALYEAGGPTKYADLSDVQVLSSGKKERFDVTKLIHGDVSQNPTLHDGDLIFVHEGHKIMLSSVFQAILSAVSLVRFVPL